MFSFCTHDFVDNNFLTFSIEAYCFSGRSILRKIRREMELTTVTACN
jgi:hypothetical protein